MRRKVHLNQNYIFCLIRINLYGALDSGVCSPKKHNLNILGFLRNFLKKMWKKCDQTFEATGYVYLYNHYFVNDNLK